MRAALRSCAANAPLFGAAAAAMLGLSYLLFALLPVPVAATFAVVVVGSAFATILYLWTIPKAAGTPRAADRWGRLIERLWAVVLVNALGQLLFVPQLYGLPAGGFAAFGLEVAASLAQIVLTFADVYACVQPDVSPAALLPAAVRESARVTTKPQTIVPVVGIALLWLLVAYASNALSAALAAAHVPDPAFWGTMPLTVVAMAPICTLTAALYRASTRDDAPPPA